VLRAAAEEGSHEVGGVGSVPHGPLGLRPVSIINKRLSSFDAGLVQTHALIHVPAEVTSRVFSPVRRCLSWNCESGSTENETSSEDFRSEFHGFVSVVTSMGQCGGSVNLSLLSLNSS